MASEYSDKEVALFQALGLGHQVPHLSPAPFYRLAMEKAFVEGWSGPAVESLRRCVEALGVEKGAPVYRRTPEFDTLISLDPEKEPWGHLDRALTQEIRARASYATGLQLAKLEATKSKASDLLGVSRSDQT